MVFADRKDGSRVSAKLKCNGLSVAANYPNVSGSIQRIGDEIVIAPKTLAVLVILALQPCEYAGDVLRRSLNNLGSGCSVIGHVPRVTGAWTRRPQTVPSSAGIPVSRRSVLESRPVSWDPGTESGIEDPGRHGRFIGLIPIVVIELPPYPSRGGAHPRWLWNDHGEGSAGPPVHDLGPFLFSRSNELHVEL